MTLRKKILPVTTIIFDIDGVLTDGRIGYGCGSDQEIKFFHVRDGHAVRLAQRAGICTGVLSGRACDANNSRMRDLHMDFIYSGVLDKHEGILRIFRERNLKPEECMYIGDDVVDARPMELCGFSVVVGDGVPELDRVADYRTKHPGGAGAVREAIELLLKEQGKWDTLMKKYFDL